MVWSLVGSYISSRIVHHFFYEKCGCFLFYVPYMIALFERIKFIGFSSYFYKKIHDGVVVYGSA